MIAGGAEEFSPTQVAVFDTLFATSVRNDAPDKTPAPFDAQRDGLVIGEGAGKLQSTVVEYIQKLNIYRHTPKHLLQYLEFHRFLSVNDHYSSFHKYLVIQSDMQP